MAIENAIIAAMKEAHQCGYDKLYPWQVQVFAPFRCSERQMRRFMADMAEKALIVRLGYKKGYALA